MAKAKRNVSGNALTRRTESLIPSESEDTPEVEAPQAEEPKAAEESQPEELKTADAPQPKKPKAAQDPTDAEDEDEDEDDDEGEQDGDESAPLSKRSLQKRFIEAEHHEMETDMIYLPGDLYEVFRTVWYDRKKGKRSYKKSHLIIEALLRHPDIVEELKREGLLKS